MKKVVQIASIATVSLALTSHALADGHEKSEIAKSGFIEECGIGAAIFKENKTGAIISNIIWDLGSTALTSAYSSPSSCSGSKVQAAAFIVNTYDQLAVETVKGQGDHLAALLTIAGCDQVAASSVVNGIRADFGKVLASSAYSTKTVAQKSEDYLNVLQANSATCSLS